MDENRPTAVNTTGHIRENPQTATADIASQVKNTAEEIIERIKTSIEAIAADLAERAPETAQRVRNQAGTMADHIYRTGGEYLSRNVQAYPATSLFIAGAVGFGLGYLLTRRY